MKRTLALAACLVSSLALAQNVPTSVSFNARLVDSGGSPVTGSHALGFALYDAPAAGSAVWTESIPAASFTSDGLVFLELGAVTPLTPQALDGRKMYLEVTVDGTVLAPRLGIVSVPYAIRASTANTALALANGASTVTANDLQRRVTGTCNSGQAVRSIDVNGGVVCENVMGGAGGDVTSVTTAAGSGLAGGATSGDIALSLATCATGEVLRSNGTGWACATIGATAGGGLTSTNGNLGLVSCAMGEILKYNGSTWACAADSAGGSFVAGNGLTLTGNSFAVNFGGTGTANTAARSDHTHGTLYTRWGVSTCPGSAQLIYAGFASGAHYQHGGSGANTVCLASAPVWTSPTGTLLAFNDTNQDQALIYGTEYEMDTTIGLQSRQDYDAACAVCLQPNASNNFMYPGASTCPAGWNTEYYGYLMSSAYMQAKQDWVCVDVNPSQSGSNTNSNGHLFYATEAECGALPCGAGQYVQNREVTCSVCTR